MTEQHDPSKPPSTGAKAPGSKYLVILAAKEQYHAEIVADDNTRQEVVIVDFDMLESVAEKTKFKGLVNKEGVLHLVQGKTVELPKAVHGIGKRNFTAILERAGAIREVEDKKK